MASTNLTLEEQRLFSAFLFLARKNTGLSLLSIEEVREVYFSGRFTFEDMFDEYINQLDFTENLEYFWVDNMTLYSNDIYFPEPDKKLPEGGSWVKIRVEGGFEVHFAKTAKKYNLNKLAVKTGDAYMKCLKKLSCTKVTQDRLHFEWMDATLRALIGLIPYRIRINTLGKSPKYFYTSEYEILDSIDEYIECIMDKVPGIEMEQLYTSDNSDRVFYLRSRGIPKPLAQLMSNLHSCYFKCDMKLMIETFNKSFKFKLVKS